MSTQVQITRATESTWTVTRVIESRTHVYRYDTVARIVFEGDLHYVELAYWEGGVQKWMRRPKGYQLFKGAERWASDYALGKVEGS